MVKIILLLKLIFLLFIILIQYQYGSQTGERRRISNISSISGYIILHYLFIYLLSIYL